ncbi:MAG: hypothetical protein JSS60_05805 [Verrucomicrobia bacterium]|nr:hypothetical protein [Verrucomicrobiota bacterium]
MNIRSVFYTASLFLSFEFIPLYAESNYVLCIEGGGSKTILQALDQSGQTIPLFRNEIITDRIEAGGSNINVVGAEGIREVLSALFENTSLAGQSVDLVSLIPKCRLVAGMAGVALPQNKQAVVSVFEEWGFAPDDILVMSDAEMALQLIEGEGIILISGTGSICFGKKDQTMFRVGGLGKILGDEGSGYQIGLQAIKAGVAEEYGWGTPSSLTPALKEFFSVPDLKSLIPKINLGEMPHSKIARCAPVVFEKAWDKDAAAEAIINGAAKDLSALLSTMLKISSLSHCQVHLWGGVFKNAHSDAFIQKILDQMTAAHENLEIINQSQENAAVLFACRKLLSEASR